MKKIITLLLLMVTTLSIALGQMQILEEERSMTQGINVALIMDIPNADDKVVEKLWKKFMKTKDSKTKKIKKSQEWLSSEASIPTVGGGSSVNVHATFEQSGGSVRMTSWFNMGDSYLNSQDHPERYSAAEEFLNAFEYEVYKDRIKKEIKEEENNLKKLEGEMKKLKKNNTRYHKEIDDAKKKIAKMEENIETNLVEQDETTTKIDEQKKVVELTRRKLDVREDN